MINKINKILSLLKNYRKIKDLSNELLLDKQLCDVLTAYNISSLPVITVEEFSKYFINDLDNSSINILTDFSQGISPVNDYYFLCKIAEVRKIKTYFEIGTWIGLSAYNIVHNLGSNVEVYTLDLPYDHPEIKFYNIPLNILGHYCKGFTNIHCLKDDSKNFDFIAFEGKIDLVFIDGNHSFEYVKNDTQKSLKLLKNDNSIIVWHDYLLNGEPNRKVLCGILDAIPANKHKHLYHLDQSNLAMYSESFNFTSSSLLQWHIPKTNFAVNFKINHLLKSHDL